MNTKTVLCFGIGCFNLFYCCHTFQVPPHPCHHQGSVIFLPIFIRLEYLHSAVGPQDVKQQEGKLCYLWKHSFPTVFTLYKSCQSLFFSLLFSSAPCNWALIYLFTFKGRYFYIIHWFTRMLQNCSQNYAEPLLSLCDWHLQKSRNALFRCKGKRNCFILKK